MNYNETLNKYIVDSGLSLGEISLRLKNNGIDISKSYISKLKNGDKPPASEEVTRALAEITGGDPEKLLLARFIEKSPKNIKPILREHVLRQKLLNNEKACQICGNDEYLEIHRTEPLGNNTDVLDVNSYMVLCPNCHRKMNNSNSIPSNMHKVSESLRVPVLGFIAAGSPIFADEHIESFMEIPNLYNNSEGELFVLKVRGDSMEGSRIYDGDKVVVRIQPEVENGEIAVVNVNGYEATLKKVKKLDNGQVWLFPSNDKYDPILLDNENARIVGKVIQVMFEPK